MLSPSCFFGFSDLRYVIRVFASGRWEIIFHPPDLPWGEANPLRGVQYNSSVDVWMEEDQLLFSFSKMLSFVYSNFRSNSWLIFGKL